MSRRCGRSCCCPRGDRSRLRRKAMPDENQSLTVADLAVTPVRELLKLAGELFIELLEAPAEFTDDDRERARMLRLTLAEAASRAARVYPTPPNAGACSCG